MIKLSVIIPCFNAAKTIAIQLEALAKQECSEPWEIIIADNNSTDNTVEIVKEYQQHLPMINLVSANSMQGAGYARNVAAKAAKGEALAFCDADDEVDKGWVSAMIRSLSEHDFVVGSNEYSQLNEAWAIESCKYREINGVKDFPYYPYAATNNLGIKRSIHNAVGGFDNQMLLLEDVDYCWRVQQTGVKLENAPDALVHIRLRDNIADMYRRYRKLACYDIVLHRKHQQLGMPKLIKWQDFIKDMLMLCAKFLVKVRSKENFARWLIDFAWFHGHLQGCIKYKYLPV
ncbi:MAG: glycosyltransferase [Cyanobacteria bacterium P01_A01_bin.84]